jgi:hypothetical protein
MARKTELKQKQSQKVVVNINTEKRKKRSKPRQKQEAKPVQPAQTISQAFPYLGLQSANNAQLLNSLQNSLNILYAKNKSGVTAPTPASGLGFTTALAPAAPVPVPVTVSAPITLPKPPVVTTPPTAPVPVTVSAPITMPKPPVVRTPPAAPAAPVTVSAPITLPRPPVVTTPTLVPLPTVSFPSLTRPPPPPPPPPPRAPSLPTAVPVLPKQRAPQRLQSDGQPAIGQPAREPVAKVTGAVRSGYDLDTNKDGTVKKRGDKWKSLPQDVRNLIIQEELAATPVKARRIKNDQDTETDTEVVKRKPRKKKEPEMLEVDKTAPIEDTNIKETISETPSKVEKSLLSQVLYGRTEMKPEPPPKTLLSLLPDSKSSKVEVATGDETDYGKLVSKTQPF